MGRDKEREKVDILVAKENGNGKDKSEEIMSACQNRLIGTCLYESLNDMRVEIRNR